MIGLGDISAIAPADALAIAREGEARRELLGTVRAGDFAELAAQAEREPAIVRGAALVQVHGPMLPRASRFDEIFFGAVSTFGLEAELRALAANDDVESIVLDIDSPGGSVTGLPELAATVRDVRKSKPVIAIANTKALSAAFWLAAQADTIVAVESSLLGSMGVFFKHADISEMLKAEGVKITQIALGARKLEFSSIGPLDEKAIERSTERVQMIFDRMVDDVAEGRGMPRAQVLKAFGSSRVFTAAESLKLGMIDRISPVAELLEQRPATRAQRQAAARAEADGESLLGALAELKKTLSEV